MRTYDAILVLVILVWWLIFRKRYDWRAVVFCYMAGVFVVDVIGALLVLIAYRRYPSIVSVFALLMPIGGIVGLAYGASKGKLDKEAGLFRDRKQPWLS